MFERDNSFQPDSTFTNLRSRDFKPAKQRKFQTLLLNGFDGNTQSNVIDLIIKEVYPERQAIPRITICANLGDNELPIEDMLRIFNAKNVIVVIKTPNIEDRDDAMLILNLCKNITNYLLRDPHSLDIPLIVFDFASIPDGCKYMCDTMISHHSASLFPITETQAEISRRKHGASGGLIDLSSVM